MRVLHVFDHSIPLHSGYSFRSKSILEEQRALGWETFHLTSSKHDRPFTPRETVDGLEFFRTPASIGLLSRLPVLNQWAVVLDMRRRLEEIIDEVKPDILHAHSPCLTYHAAAPIARRRGIPLVYEMRASWEDAAVSHGTCREGDLRYRLGRALETRALRGADAVMTICEGLRTEIGGRGVAADKITVIPNAVNVDSLPFLHPAKPELRDRLGLSGTRVLGFIGSFYHYEGLHLLLDAMPRILEVVPNARLLLVGGGFEADNLKEQAKVHGDAVVFTGRVPHEEVIDYYALCDVMVYPRLDMRLTRIVTPLKPLEAMAQGRIVVASDIGGHRELIRDGKTGTLFQAGSAEALATTVLDVLAHEGRWKSMRENGRTFVETERTWARSISNYVPVFESLCARR